MAAVSKSASNRATTRVACQTGVSPGLGSYRGWSAASSNVTDTAPRSLNQSESRSASSRR